MLGRHVRKTGDQMGDLGHQIVIEAEQQHQFEVRRGMRHIIRCGRCVTAMHPA